MNRNLQAEYEKSVDGLTEELGSGTNLEDQRLMLVIVEIKLACLNICDRLDLMIEQQNGGKPVD